jgi:competence protein ComEC
MIRRHVTPALVAFFVLLACVAARPILESRWRVLAALSILPAAASVVLSSAPGPPGRPDTRRAGLIAMSAAAGLSLGALSLARISATAQSASFPVRAGEVSEFTGVLIQDSSLTRRGDTVLLVALESASSARAGVTGSARGTVRAFVAGDYRFSLGQRVTIHAPVSPSLSAGPESSAAWTTRDKVRTDGFSSAVWAFRASVRDGVTRALDGVGYPSSALLDALLIGSREDVPAPLEEAFLRTGSLHILALSGMHVTILYGIAAGLLWFVRGRWLKFLLATVALLFYQFVAGFMPSLLRATITILAGGTAMLLDRDHEPMNLLSIAGIAVILVDPFQAFTVSYQLSFLALAGILAVGPLVERGLSGVLPRVLRAPLAMSLGAQAATFPLVILVFGSWYPSGLVASLVLVPLTTAFIWAGCAWLAVSWLPWPGLKAAAPRVFDFAYRAIEGSARLLSRPPGIDFSAAAGGAAAAAAVALLACVCILFPRRQGRPPRIAR